MYNSVLDSHEKSKDLEKAMKDLSKEVQTLRKEKEVVENQKAEAIKKHTELELDVKDLEEKMSGNVRAKVCFDYVQHSSNFHFYVSFIFHV